MAGDSSDGSSTSAVISSLIFYGIIGSIIYFAFSMLRPKERRVYEPKTMELAKTNREQVPPTVPGGPVQWALFLFRQPRSFLLQYAGVDAYLFSRYVGMFAGVSLLGCFILLPILLPVNATGGQDLPGFDLLAFANVTNNKRYYAHVFLSWLYFGLVMFVIYKELIFYISLRHSIQTSPLYDGLLSSRTLLLSDISEKYTDEDSIRTFFPTAQRIWYARNFKELEKLTEERSKLAGKYEGALNKIISKGLKLKKKLVKKGEALPQEPQGYIKKDPTHRLGKIPFIGKKVVTVDYCIDRIDELNKEIGEAQKTPETAKLMSSVFIEFPNQLEAQKAYQAVPYTKDFKLRALGCAPDDILWPNLSQKTKERASRTTAANSFLSAMIIFWAIPVAVVGCISNIPFLTDKIHFLRFINNCPSVILGLITGILPTVALAILMSFVPVIIKKAGKMSGMITEQQVELYCQSWYFGFQIVQVFLVVTLASSASSTVTAIIDDPGSAMTLLAQNLPKASNFYIAYFLLQGLMTPAMSLLQIGPLILSKALKFLQNTPRKKWEKYNTLSMPSWGVVYPPLQLLVCIFIIYSIISPLILLFSTFTFGMLYLGYLYLIVYVYGQPQIDMRGRNYPKALFQTFVGLYLAEICLLGLFIMAKTWGPVVLEAIVLGVTVCVHLFLRWKFEPLLDTVPISAIKEARGEGALYPQKDLGLAEIKETGKNFIDHHDANAFSDSNGQKEEIEPAVATANGDSASSRNETVVAGAGVTTRQETAASAEAALQDDINHANFNTLEEQAKTNPKQVLKRFFNPKDGYNFALIRSQLPHYFNLTTTYSSSYLDGAYNHPAITDEEPHIWIPKDPLGISEYEISKADDKVDVKDINTEFNEKDAYEVTGPPPAYEEVIKA